MTKPSMRILPIFDHGQFQTPHRVTEGPTPDAEFKQILSDLGANVLPEPSPKTPADRKADRLIWVISILIGVALLIAWII